MRAKRKKTYRFAALLAVAAAAVCMLAISVPADDSAETTRTVSEDGTALTAVTTDGVDTYTVTKKTRLTVTYENEVDAEELINSFGTLIKNNQYWSSLVKYGKYVGLSLSDGDDGWAILQKCYNFITDDTYVNLKYTFSDGVDLSSVDLSSLASSIKLDSNMFSFSGEASDLSVSGNTLTITCWWNNTASKGNFNETITISGVTVPITSDWGTVTDADGTISDADSLQVTASGSVGGEVSVGIKITRFGITLVNISDDLTLTEQTVVEKDTFLLTLAKTSITVNKSWNDSNDADGIRPDSVTVSLLKNETATGDTVTLSESNDWSASFGDLAAYDDGGDTISYSVSEANVSGYTAGYSDVSGSATDGYNVTVTNTHEYVTTSLKVTKTWEDSNDADGIRPASVTVRLYADGVDTGKTATLNAENNWTASFTELAAYTYNSDAAATAIKYTVSEDSVNGYTTDIGTVTGGVSDGYKVTITNKLITTSLTVTKTWDDADDANGIRPDSVTVTLLQNGEATEKTASLSEGTDGTWTATFSGLPAYDANGNKISYSVEETSVNGYTSSVGDVSGSADDGYSVTITNTLITTSLTVTKTWDDADDIDALRAGEVTVTLYADGVKTENTMTLSKENDWTGTFTGLNAYTADGTLISYSVMEDSLAGYTTVITVNLTVTVSVGESSSFSSLTALLYAAGSDTVLATAQLTAENGWTCTFSGLDAYDEEGNLIEYEVQVINPDSDTDTDTDDSDDGSDSDSDTDTDEDSNAGEDFTYSVTRSYTTISTHIPVGALTVQKTVSGTGASTSEAFVFTVTLSDTSISGTYGDLTFADGIAVFTLKAGESVTASGIPAGVTYVVTENESDGYTMTSSGAEGTITANTTALAAFNNHKDAEAAADEDAESTADENDTGSAEMTASDGSSSAAASETGTGNTSSISAAATGDRSGAALRILAAAAALIIGMMACMRRRSRG